MEKQVLFRDRQELQSGDLNNIQAFARLAIDRIVKEGLTSEKKFTGFNVSKSGATEISITTGAYWSDGAVYIREAAHSIDFLSDLPLVTKRIAAVVVTGSQVETDIQPRDFLIDVDTDATEPDSVAMEALRYAQFSTVLGTENSAPQKPQVGSDVLVIAWVTLTTTGVESIERATANELMSAKKLDQRATSLETWRKQAGERITTLGTDISTLSNRVSQAANTSLLTRVFADVATLKELMDLEDNYSGYGADNFLSVDNSISDTDAVGYYAKVEEGMRFPNDNASNVAISLFNPLDASVKVASNGLALPVYSEVNRLSLDQFYQELSIDQYEYQEVDFKLNSMSARRIRFGVAFTVCNNSEFWKTGTYDTRKGIFTDKLGRTYQTLNNNEDVHPKNGGFDGHAWIRLQQFWYDEEVEYYQDRVVTEFTVNGSMVAQTLLNTQGGWMTSVDLFFTQVGITGDVRVLITNTVGGRPDLTRVIAETTLPVAGIVQGSDASNAEEWTNIPITPTCLAAGERYGIVLITGGDHYIGLTQGTNYAAGTLFYSTDGAFFQGDLTLDMMMKLNFASFTNVRAEIDLSSLNLSGGINDIDIAYEGVTPEGTELYFEVRPEGSATWYSLGEGAASPFTGLPALINFRAVFVGTADLMPGLRLTDSDVKVSRPATTMTWFSDQIDLPAASQSVKVIVTLDRFNEANHDFDVVLNDVTNASNDIAAATETDEILSERDGTRKQIRRTFEWTATELPVATSAIVIKATGSLAAATEVFHGERLVYLTF